MALSASRAERWPTLEQVEALSRELHDPPQVAELRGTALAASQELPIEPNPLYRKYGYFQGVDLSDLDAAAHGPPVELPSLAPALVRITHDRSGTRVEIPPALAEAGVQVRTLEDVWRQADGGPGAFLEGLEPSGPRGDKLEALTIALVNRGVEVELPDRLPVPVRIQDLTILTDPGQALSVRRKIRAGASSQLVYSEEVYSSQEPDRQRFYGSLTRLEVGSAARVAYLTVHEPDARAVASYSRGAQVHDDARLAWIFAGYGGFRTRLRNYSDLPGRGSDLNDLQAYYGDRQQSFDSNVQVTHIGTDTHGQSLSRGVFRDESRGLSRGLVRIEKDARKTISLLSEHAMLLSRGARSDTIPVLEILCRDVKATHSSSAAPIDPERIFYLKSRGIPEAEAVRMIGEGFLSHVLDRAPIADLREILFPLLTTRWNGRYSFWRPDEFPALPPLRIADPETGEEWRFDAKLR
jgi:Fe-S cluster assembly scaffold protein SufB